MLHRFFKKPGIIVAGILALTVFFGLQLVHLRLDNSIRQYFPHKDSSYVRLTDSESVYGSMVCVGITIETIGDSIITPENIEVIKRITSRIEELDQIDNIDSLTCIDYVYGADGSLIAGDLLGDEYTGSPEDIALIKEKIIDWEDMYDRVILSDDGKATQIQITVKSGVSSKEEQRLIASIRSIVQEETAGLALLSTVVGDPVVTDTARIFMISDLVRLIPLVVLAVLLCLFFSFCTLDGTLMPLITVLISTIWSCGLMAIFDVPFTIVSSVIPVALIAVGSAYGIHVLTHYYIELDHVKGEMTKEIHKDIIIKGLKDVFGAVMLAGLTTVVGFISLVTSPLGPLHSFAIFAACGVAVSLLLAITFIPALLMIKPVNKIGKKSKFMQKLVKKFAEKSGGSAGKSLYAVYRTCTGSKLRLAFFCAVILCGSCYGIKKLVIDTVFINYFPKESKLRQDVQYVDDRFAGTNSISFLITGEEKGDLTKSEILEPVDHMQSYLESKYPNIGKIVSFTTFIKRMNQVMHIPESPEYYDGQPASSVASGDSLGSFGSFGDDSLSSFGDSLDSFGSFGDDSLSSFGDSSGSFGFADSEAATAPEKEFIDPNIEYSRQLSESIPLSEFFAMMNNAYVASGGKRANVKDMVHELEKQLNYNGAAYYEIPADIAKYPAATREELSDLVAQYLLLFSGSLDRFADDALQPKQIRVQLQLRSHNTDEIGTIIADAKAYAERYFPEGYTLEATGVGELEYTMTNLVVSSQLSSLLFSLISVFVIIAIAFKSPWAGLLGCIPLSFTILLNYMVMGIAHINLDLVTSIIASVAVGVGIDYTIHFLSTYKAERAVCDDLQLVIERTLAKSGRAIVTNAVAVGFGFLVLCLSEFIVLRYIGVLVAIVMFTSSLLAMTVIPGFLNIFDPKFIRPKKAAEETDK